MDDAPDTIAMLVLRDHRVLHGLLDRFDHEAVGDWGTVFREFVDYELRHEEAEHQVLYPALAEAAAASVVHSPRDRVEDHVEQCRADERAIGVRLELMEVLDPSDPRFREHLSRLREEMDAHAAREEQHLLPALVNQDSIDLGELGRAYERARMAAAGRAADLERS